MYLQRSLINSLIISLFAYVLVAPAIPYAATKSATKIGSLNLWLGNQYVAFPYSADTSFQWWGYWAWDYSYNNWATNTWDLRIGGTVTGGRAYYPAFTVEPIQPNAWWVDLVTGSSLQIYPGYMYDIGCIVNPPNSCRQTAYYG